MTTVILDNFDSFTYNLFQYVGELGQNPLVFRNDQISIRELREIAPDYIIVSPGPGSPDDPSYFGVCSSVITVLGPTVPLLGVCLGHQGIISAFGGRIVRAPKPMHGKTSAIHHTGKGIFSGVPNSFDAMRYHSLVGDPGSIPDCLEVVAKTADDIIMGVQHRAYPIYGVQFHPESVGTPVGKQLLRNFFDVGRSVDVVPRAA